MPILVDLTRGTSRENETDVFDLTEGRWKICFDYRFEEEGWTVLHHWCTWEDDPEPFPPMVCHYFAACPGTCYPDRLATSTVTTSGSCDCLALSFLELVWDGTIGPWGGWAGTNTACTGNPITIKIYPSAAGGGGGLIWTIDVTWPGGGDTRNLTAACGQGFIFTDILINRPACGRARASVFVSWPGSLPP